MYCQKCGARNAEGVRFCRACGNSLTPEVALVAQSPPSPNYERAFKKLFMGIAFVVFAFIPLFSHHGFWWWMLFPAAALLAKGIGELMQGRTTQPIARQELGEAPRGMIAPPTVANPRVLSPQVTSNLAPPPSISEETTGELSSVEKERSRDA
jgi:hypothetical protein